MPDRTGLRVSRRIDEGVFFALQGWAAEIGICLLAVLIFGTGAFSQLSLGVVDSNFELLKRHASGEVIVVQIDAKSLKALDSWPWPRSRHGELIDILHKSGAATIAVDIDFSSASSGVEDQALASAITRAEGTVVLPSFVQPASEGKPELVETFPLGILARSALVGNANIVAPNGLVREAAIGRTGIGEGYRPSFASLIGQSREAGVGSFGIDYSIDRSTIPHVSYVDVLQGRFDPALVRGKKVIVGATAIELGDRVAVPVYGVIAGVDLQALIAESILQNRMLLDSGVLGQWLGVLFTLVLLRPGRRSWKLKELALRAVLCALGLVLSAWITFEFAAVIFDPLPGLAAIGLGVLWVGLRELGARARAVLRERSTSSMRRSMIELIVEGSSDGIVVVREGGRIELCNEQAAHLLNVTRKTLTGRPVQNFLPALQEICSDGAGATEDQGRCDLELENSEGKLTVELMVRRTQFIDWYGAARDRATWMDIYTLRDVTAVRNARAAETRAQEERLLAERAKNNFVANMSHELRTPLNAIIGFSEMLANEVLGPVEQRAYVEHAGMVANSGHHLLAIVNNVIDVARLDSEAHEVTTSQFAFSEVAEAAKELVTALSAYSNQTIEVNVAPSANLIESDYKLLKHVVYNLLSNAVKFSPADGCIRISAWAETTELQFEIVDQGCGIDPEVLPRVAQLFGHAESGFTRAHDGLGVGLHLVRRCLEKLGGALTFDTAKGQGTRVLVRLPNAVRSAEAIEAA